MNKKIHTVFMNSIVINVCLVFFKMFIGIVGNSQAMVADGINSLSDLITDFIAVFGINMSEKEADENHPFGYGRVEYLASIIVGIFILIMGISLIINSFGSVAINPSFMVLFVSIVIFISKYLFSKYMFKMGNKYKSSLLITSSFEARANAMSTLFVIIAYLLSKLSVYNSLFLYSDNVCTFGIGLYVIYVSYGILKDNILNVIGSVEDNIEFIEKIKNKILNNDNIVDVNDVRLIKYGSYYSADIDIVMKKSIKLKDIEITNNKIKKQLCNKRTGIKYLHISVIPDD